MMKVWQDGSEPQSLALDGPGGTVRFAVGEVTGAQSSIWRLWAPPNHSDIYVAARDLAGKQKVSLHESGDWRFQFVNEEVAKRFAPETGRMIDNWPRPPEVGAGWTRAFTIWIPEQDIVPADARPAEGKLVRWLPKPEPGRVVCFQVVVAKPDLGVVKLDEVFVVDGFSLVNGESCLLLASLINLTPPLIEWLNETRARLEVQVRQVDLGNTVAPRVVAFGDDVEHTRMMWDLAL